MTEEASVAEEISDLNSFEKRIHQALRAWQTPGGTPENLLASLLLVQTRRARLNSESSPALLRLAANEVLLQGIEELAVQDEVAANILNLRFPANKSLLMVAHQLNVSEHTVSRWQREAISRLAHILFEQEMALRQTHIQKIEALLPPPTYSQLFGVAETADHLRRQILAPQSPWVIALVGMGGIGKTALANYVARQIIRDFRFEDVVWLHVSSQTMNNRSTSSHSAFENVIADLGQHFWPESDATIPTPQRLIQVRQRLKSRPFLIIIDNLESETDTAYLLHSLNDMANPSKFLLTSRTRLAEQGTVLNYGVSELPLADAVALLRHHASDVGVQAMSTAASADVESIYQVVGGNPLALKLVISLLDLLPLSQVMSGLVRSRPGQIEGMYRHIYWQVWQLLSANARQLLQAMPLVAESGGAPDYLRALSGLAETDLWPALQELRHCSLLEVRGTLQEKRYGIHRLTETFLHTEIIHWPVDNIIQ